jgi:ribosomal protein S18 acetylase RimI-like enzyme
VATGGKPEWIYNSPVRLLTGAAEILAACDHHPMARFAIGAAAQPTGCTDTNGTLFFGQARDDGTSGYFIGAPDGFAELFELARAAGLTERLAWLHAPRGCPVPDGMRLREEWGMLWTTRRPAAQEHQAEVRPLPATPTVADEINALLDLAMPDTTVRPGHRSEPRWYGIRAGGVLVACAADRTGGQDTPEPVGVIGGVAVHPDYRGQRYGAAISAGTTTALLDRYDLVILGVWLDNHKAIRLYQRLGYSEPFIIAAFTSTAA